MRGNTTREVCAADLMKAIMAISIRKLGYSRLTDGAACGVVNMVRKLTGWSGLHDGSDRLIVYIMLNLKHKKTCLLSIIIPVYNVEEFILQCLESVVSCNLEDCEIILSLGESGDRSSQICEEFVSTHPVARIIKQSGKGLSDARNCAMRQANGQYLLFIDSDDSVNSHYLDQLIEKLRVQEYTPDVIVTDYQYHDCRFGVWRTVYQIGEDTPDQYSMDFLPTMLQKRGGFWNVWRYVYRKAFLDECGITFWENTAAEDMDFTARVFQENPNIVFTHCPYYRYTIGRGGSLMDRPTLQRFRETEKVIRVNCERLASSKFIHASLIRARYQYEYILAMAEIVQFAPSERKDFVRVFKSWKSALADSEDPIVKFACFALRLMGVRGLGYALYILKWIHHTQLERSFHK